MRSFSSFKKIVSFAAISILITSCFDDSTLPTLTPPADDTPAASVPTPWATSITAETVGATYNAIISASDGGAIGVGALYDSGTITFNGSVTATGAFTSNQNALIAKYSSAGVVEWASSPTTAPNESRFASVAFDSDGNIYAGGYIVGTSQFDFGNSSTVTAGVGINHQALLVKYNSSGVAQWARSVASGEADSDIGGVAVDSAGNVYAAGILQGNSTAYDFGNSVTVTGVHASYTAYIIKFNSSGVAQWAKTLVAASSTSRFNALAIDSSDNIYAAGYVNDNGAFNFGDSVTLTGGVAGQNNFVLVKYSSTGFTHWARTASAGSAASTEASSVAVNSDGSKIIVAGVTATGLTNFGNSISFTTPASSTTGFLVAYNSSGLAQWANVSQTTGASSWPAVGVDSNGAVYFCSQLVGAGIRDFGNSITVNNTGAINRGVIVKFNSSGVAQDSLLVSQTSGSSEDSQFLGCGGYVDGDGVFAGGYINDIGVYDFDGQTANGVFASANPVATYWKP